MTRSRFSFNCLAAVAALALALTASPAAASPTATPVSATPLLGGYWQEFWDHWTGLLKKQNGVIMAALGVGAVSLIIITRGKWRK